MGPQRNDEPDDTEFLSKVRLVGRNVVAACQAYNAKGSTLSTPLIERLRLCLVSGGKFAGRVPKDQVARQLVYGVLDAQLSPEVPEVQFAYDGDVFHQVWEAL